MKSFLGALALLFIGCANYPHQPDACHMAQERLTELDCEQQATPEGTPFEVVCRAQLGAYPAGCLWELDSCENFDKYYFKEGCQ